MSKKAVAANSLLNIIANAVPLLVLQLAVLPLLNKSMGAEAYGLVVTLVSVFALFPSVFSNCLNNVRIISDYDYEKEGIRGDFNILSVALGSVSMVLCGIVGTVYIGAFSVLDLIGLTVVGLLYFLDGYYYVAFLIRLDYKRVLIRSLLRTVGHVVGLGVFFVTGWWYWVYLVGYLFAVVYVFSNSNLVKEPLIRTPRFKNTTKRLTALLAATFIANIATYADRLLLYPLLGGTAVAVYYASTLLGKLVVTVVSPAANVLLTTLGRSDRMDVGNLKYLLGATFLFGIIAYAICMLAFQPVIGLLYPDLVSEAANLVMITTAASVVTSLSAVINPVLLRFCSTVWQLVLSVLSVATYVLFSFSFASIWGIVGFAIGALLSSTIVFCVRLAMIHFLKPQIAGS